MHSPPHILLVGCGAMGGALLKGWLAHDLYSVVIVNPSPPPDEWKHLHWHSAPKDIDRTFKPDVIVLAVKPQIMIDVLPHYAHYEQSAFLSIAAGLTLDYFTKILGPRAIIRAMPNIAARIGQSMSVAVANDHTSPTQHALCDELLRAAGDLVWLEQEQQINAAMALSGCGPAYLFALTEAMAKAGEAMGLSKELSQQLARQTIIGSSALLAQSSEPPEVLRQAVTSRGGATEAALKQLHTDNTLNILIQRAMQAAADRAKELSVR